MNEAVVGRSAAIIDLGNSVAIGGLSFGGVDGVTYAIFDADSTWTWNRAKEGSLGTLFSKNGEHEDRESSTTN